MLDFSPELWILTLVTALVASAITTIASIGVGLIIFGVLSFFVDLKTIIPFVAVAQLFGVSVRYWVFRRHVHWRLAGLFMLGAVPGIYGGTLIFHWLTEDALRRILGLFLLVFAAYEFSQRKALRAVPHTALLPLGGLGAGIVSGSIGVGGPLLVLVFLRYGLLKEELVAMTSLFFLLGNTQRALLYWQQGALHGESLGLAAGMGAAMIVGVYLGRAILPRVSRELFVKMVLGILVLFGMQFLLL